MKIVIIFQEILSDTALFGENLFIFLQVNK